MKADSATLAMFTCVCWLKCFKYRGERKKKIYIQYSQDSEQEPMESLMFVEISNVLQGNTEENKVDLQLDKVLEADVMFLD